jgi:hypothetical protein
MVKKEQRVLFSKELPYIDRLTWHIEQHLKDGFHIVSVTPQHVSGTGGHGYGGFLIVFEKTIE